MGHSLGLKAAIQAQITYDDIGNRPEAMGDDRPMAIILGTGGYATPAENVPRNIAADY
jgi:hypothetical protein